MSRRRLYLLLLLGTTLIAACRRSAAPPISHTAVRVAAVETMRSPWQAQYSARIEPDMRVDLAFMVSGHVDYLASTKGPGGERPIAAGDVVQAGERLASLRAVELLQRTDQARAAAASALAAFEQAKSDAERAAQLAQSGAVSSATLDSVRSREASTSAAVRGSEAQLQEALTLANERVLRSPITGTVLSRTIERGSLVERGVRAFSIARTDPVKAIIGVPDTVLAQLRVGAAVSLSSAAYADRRFAGHISRIAPAADPQSRTFEIEISTPNPDGLLKIGMVAAATLTDAATGAVPSRSVPLAALVRSPLRAGAFAVFAVEGGAEGARVHAVDVELGTTWGPSVPVTEGLTGRERIVVQGAGLLSDGERVEVIP